MALLILLVGLSFASKPAPVVDAVIPTPNPVDADGFELLPAPIWKPERIRWCGLIETAVRPERAGKAVSTALEVGRKEGANFFIWHFYDEAKNLTLSTEASQCLSQVKVGNEDGDYRFSFTLPTDVVATDAAVDAASASGAAWTQCVVDHPEARQADVVVATVVDLEGKVWTSDGTTEKGNLRSCIAPLHTAWVNEQIAGGTFTLKAPAVVFGRVLATPPAAAPAAPTKGLPPKSAP